MPEPAESRLGRPQARGSARGGVDTLIVGAIDYDVANVFCHAGIEVIAGAHGSAREVVQAYLTRTLTGVDELCHLDGWEHEDGHDRDLAEA